mmetsp:Transcript_52839/g.92787  ORF Transcript_52839/g.92787 Transcript_52839/m.92787 type:complete len:1086 (+) Transcript_52839:134-3391(+)
MAEAAAAEDDAPPRHQRFNIGAYRGLLDTVDTVKDRVERERADAAEKQKHLAELLLAQGKQSKAIQKELSIQLKCSGRSYQSLLSANREITEALRVEEMRRVDEVEDLQAKIKKLQKELKESSKPWLIEVAKRDQKIVKLQEGNQDLKKKVKEESEKLPPVVERFNKQLKEKEEAMESVLREVKALNETIEEQKQKYEQQIEAIPGPFRLEILKLNKEKRAISEAAEDEEAKLKREIKEYQKKIVGLQKELDAVDHTPYEKKIDAQAEGYARLAKDFQIKVQKDQEEKSKMRAGFEDVIDKMDRRIQNNVREMQARIKPLEEIIERREAKIVSLEHRIVEMRESEAETRQKERAIQEEMHKEKEVAKAAMDLAQQDLYKAQREVIRVKEELESDDGPYKKMKIMQIRLDDVTKECQAMIAHKDGELQQKNAMVQRLQLKIRDDAIKFEEFAELWDQRVQEKEKAYHKSIADLDFAEAQIVSERIATQKQRDIVKARNATIAALKEEHSEELRHREADRETLEAQIVELEEALEVECRKPEVLRAQFQGEIDDLKRRGEDRVYDLRIEIDRRDVQIEEEQFKIVELGERFEKARGAWEEKERELEVYIRGRDRNITALKNELEFLNDSWEIKYQRLVQLYEKLQKKYDEMIGPNGQAEAYRRAQALKSENDLLNKRIKVLEETIVKQKKQIRGLQIDIDQLMKETADLIAEKERGISEMAGDAVKLENKYREECLLRERLIRQKDAERLALAESFQARVDQLEQLMEAMRFNDREELIDRIALWKKNYERVCNERDDIEEHYKAVVDLKEKQLQGMLGENAELRSKMQQDAQFAADKLELTIKQWKSKELLQIQEKEKIARRITELEIELAKALREAQKQSLLKDSALEDDEEKVALKKRIKELLEQMEQIEAGKQQIIDENTSLRGQCVSVDDQLEDVHAIYKPQLAAKDREIRSMERQHEELKEILQKEMKRAQETCKDIEEQVKRFPKPFEHEIKEMKDKYAQMQVGMERIQIENEQLREAAEKQKKKLEKEIAMLEESLGLAKTLLEEVATLESLKHLSRADVINLEQFMDKDLDGDGRVGS